MAIVKGTREFDKKPTVNGVDVALVDELGGLGGSIQFFADQMDLPLNSDWAVNAFAPAARDTNNNGLIVRRFDDSTEEGVGFSIVVPSSATDMTIRYKTRAETAPGATQTAVPKLYKRSLPDNAAVSSWSSNTLTNISLPTNENWQYDEKSDTLANWGITAGVVYQFEFTRDAGNGSDNLSGDLTLYVIEVEFS